MNTSGLIRPLAASGSGWYNLSSAFDFSESTFAYNDIMSTGWGTWAYFYLSTDGTINIVDISAIKINARKYADITRMQIEVYYDDGGGLDYHNVYDSDTDGVWPDNEDFLISLSVTLSLVIVRIRFYGTEAVSPPPETEAKIYELSLFQTNIDDLASHCKLDMGMNDDAANTNVDNAQGTNGVSARNTNIITRDGIVAGGKSFIFDPAQNDTITVASYNDILLANYSMSVVIWFQRDILDTFQCLMHKYVWIDDGWAIYIENDELVFYSCTTGTYTSIRTSDAILDNYSWHCVIARKLAGMLENWVKLFLDNIELSNSVYDFDEWDISTGRQLQIGSDGGLYEFTGRIDTCQIYNRALTDLEIKYIYQDGYIERRNAPRFARSIGRR